MEPVSGFEWTDNPHLGQISKIASESAEGAQRSASAVAELAGLARELQKLVNRFRTKREGPSIEPEKVAGRDEMRQSATGKSDRGTRH
jgi:hypothetical protein